MSLGAIGLATLLPDGDPPVAEHLCVVCGTLGGVDFVLNVLLFVPLGLGLRLAGIRARIALPAMAALSVLIEMMQLMLIAGRDASAGDVISNTIGGAIGVALAVHAASLIRPSRARATSAAAWYSAGWLSIQTIGSFAFSPAIPNDVYYGQIAPRLRSFEQFSGEVTGARVGDVAIANSRLNYTSRLRTEIIAGAPAQASAKAGRPTRLLSPIVRVADARQEEVLIMAQHANDFIFSIRTGASELRLRPPYFVLDSAFSNATSSVTLSGAYADGEASISAQRGASTRSRKLSAGPSLSWTLILPFQWWIGGTQREAVLSALWLAALLLPLGYWARLAVARDPRLSATKKESGRRTGVATGIIGLTILAGLSVLPRVFDVASASAFDWIGALAGVVVGAVGAGLVSSASRPGRTAA